MGKFLRVVQDAYNCSGYYGKFCEVRDRIQIFTLFANYAPSVLKISRLRLERTVFRNLASRLSS